jgi:hypothetical protein
VLDVRVALEKGQKAEVTLVDGTRLSAERLSSGTSSGFRLQVAGASVEQEDVKLSATGGPARTYRWEVFRP